MFKKLYDATIIIPVFNKTEDLEKLILSIHQNNFGKKIEILIIDDASPDKNIFDDLKQKYNEVQFVHLEKNRGPANARNIGTERASSDILIFLDSDTILVEGSLKAIINHFENYPQINTCAGWDYYLPANQGYFASFKAIFQYSVAPKSDADLTFVPGRCFAIRRKVMMAVGGFDTSYIDAEVEDYELGYRLRKKYGPIYFLNKFRVKHAYPSFWNQFKLYYKRSYLWLKLRSKYRFFDNNCGTSLKDVFIYICSFLSIPSLLILIFFNYFNIILLLFLMLFLVNRKFLLNCWKFKGMIFTIRSLFVHSILTYSMIGGVMRYAFYLVRNKK